MVAIFLAKVSRAISGRMPFATNAAIKLLEGAWFGRGGNCGTVEQILQMVIEILVQSTDLNNFLLPLELAVHYLMIGAAPPFDAEAAVRP